MTIRLLDFGGIRLLKYSAPVGAVFVNVYCSDADGEELFWIKRVPVGTNIEIDQVSRGVTVLETQYLDAPPLGHLLEAYRGRVLVAKDEALYVSEPLGYHLFDLRWELQIFGSRIRMIAPGIDGFFVSADKTYWVSGDGPETWRIKEVDDAQVAEGKALRVSGSNFLDLQESGMVSVWATDEGPIVGMAGGRVKHLTEELVAMDGFDRASLTFRKEDGLRQVLVALQKKKSDSRFGMSDRATCSVVKAV